MLDNIKDIEGYIKRGNIMTSMCLIISLFLLGISAISYARLNILDMIITGIFSIFCLIIYLDMRSSTKILCLYKAFEDLTGDKNGRD